MSDRDGQRPAPPAPLTPPHCDLRGYDFMPLFGQKLFGSRLYARALRCPRGGLAAFKLWWSAWQQCPAGSLPDDDEDLSILADFGTDMKGWRAVRDVALHGFVRCSDGRLYHPIICAEAIDAYARRARERERKAAMRARRKGEDADIHRTTVAPPPAYDADIRSDRTEQDRDSPYTLTSFVSEDARTRLFRTGPALLMQQCGLPDMRARSLLGKWLKACGDDAASLATIIDASQTARPAEMISWVEGAIRSRTGSRQDRLAERWGLRTIGDEDENIARLRALDGV